MSAIRWRALFFLMVISGLVLYPRLSFRLLEPDEGRYAEIPREMLLRGEWVIPYLQGEPYLDKPPLLYWLVMVSYRLLGVHDWSARLVPALALHGCVLVTYLLGRRNLGERAAFWGALGLSLAPGFISIGRLLVLDGLLAFWVTLSLFAAFEALRGSHLRWGWWLTAAVACGLGILTKGPVALLLLLPPLWAHRRLTGSGCPLGRRAWLAFAGVLLTVILPWYGAICLRMPAFAGYFLWQHNVVRFVAPFDHQRPVWFYGPVMLLGLLPVSLLAWPFLRFLLSGDPDVSRRRVPQLGLMMLAGGWCLLFFSLSGCKLPTYVLPAFPPLALVLGWYITQSRWQQSSLRWVAPGLMFLLLMVGHGVVLPAYARYHSPLDEGVMNSGEDSGTPIVCYPRPCDSVAFYLGRDDLRSYRTVNTSTLVQFLREQPRTVVLFTHRHSVETLRPSLTQDLQLTGERPLETGDSRQAAVWFTAIRRLGGESRPELYYTALVERRIPGGP